MTFDKTFVYLVGAARKIWRWSKPRNELKKEAKNCANCNTRFNTKVKAEIDHIIPIGKAPRDFAGWDLYYQKLFCSKENLQALCTLCHKEKTKKERICKLKKSKTV